jgi:hypothetical protein
MSTEESMRETSYGKNNQVFRSLPTLVDYKTLDWLLNAPRGPAKGGAAYMLPY